MEDRSSEHGFAGPAVMGTDGSGAAMEAMAFALREARLRGVPLRHVCTHGPRGGTAESGAGSRPRGGDPSPPHVHDIAARDVTDSVEELRRQVGEPSVEIEVHCARGRPARVLQDASTDAGLLVLPTRGAGASGRLALVSTGTEVVHHAHVPVVVVPPAPAERS